MLLLHVGAEVGRLCEPVAAKCALERLFPSVHDHVVQQGLPGGELLLADGADQQLLARVEATVLSQIALPLETASALLALVGGSGLTLFLKYEMEYSAWSNFIKEKNALTSL